MGPRQLPSMAFLRSFGRVRVDRVTEVNPEDDVGVIAPPTKKQSVRTVVSNKSIKTRMTYASQDTCAPKAKLHVAVSRKIVENRYFIAFTTLLTLYALTGDDFRLICTNKSADIVFNIIVLASLVVFSVEVVLSCLGKEDYFLGFFFVLDLVSTGTLVLDLSWVADELAGESTNDDEVGNARAGRTARIGAKAGRIVRVIRLVRIIKLYKAVQESKAHQPDELEDMLHAGPGEEDDWDRVDLEQDDSDHHHHETRVGKRLSEMTTRRVICLVLIMLLVLPQLRVEQVNQSAASAYYGADDVYQTFKARTASEDSEMRLDYERAVLQYLFYHNWFAMKGFCPDGRTCPDTFYGHVFWMGITGESEATARSQASAAQVRSTTVEDWAEEHRDQNNIYNFGTMPSEALSMISAEWAIRCDTEQSVRLGVSLLKNPVDGIFGYAVPCPEDLRPQEKSFFRPRLQSLSESEQWHFSFFFDLRPFVRWDAGYNLGITTFVCVVLCAASLCFSADANNLVLRPVEKMILRVEAIRENPLVAMQMADEEFKAEEVNKAKKKNSSQVQRVGKLGSLGCQQALGLAKTSNEPMEMVVLEKTIIKLGSLLALGFGQAGASIIGSNMAGADTAGVSAVVPGVRVECIIGLARIQDFSIATEVLQTKIMTFVNQIAEIVHGVVDEYHGSCNKNSGDTFLVIWPTQDMAPKQKERTAGMSVVAFSKVLCSLHRNHTLAAYRGHPGLQQRLGSHCRVNLNIGLHSGWAIEGAVGSDYKIDASYLSPNVSIANHIARASRSYMVPFIITQAVFELVGELGEKCRLIDRVIVSGSPQPMELFSLDLDCKGLPIEERSKLTTWNTRTRFRARQFLESAKEVKLNGEVPIAYFFDSDRTVTLARRAFTVQFCQFFNMGYQNYSQGEWMVARDMLERTLYMLGHEDGPSAALLRFMETYQFHSPKDWAGVRDLELYLPT